MTLSDSKNVFSTPKIIFSGSKNVFAHFFGAAIFFV
jgi:hypothetical protein